MYEGCTHTNGWMKDLSSEQLQIARVSCPMCEASPPPLAASARRDVAAPRRRPPLKLLPSGWRLDAEGALGFHRRPDVSQKVQMIQ